MVGETWGEEKETKKTRRAPGRTSGKAAAFGMSDLGVRYQYLLTIESTIRRARRVISARLYEVRDLWASYLLTVFISSLCSYLLFTIAVRNILYSVLVSKCFYIIT